MNVTGSGRGKRRRPMAEINVVPYIDVSLVLLIIFMVTTPLLQTGVEVDLPPAESKAITSGKEPPMVVYIKKGGELSIATGGQTIESVENLDELRDKVLAAIKDKPNLTVVVSGDQSVSYGTVIKAMAVLKKAGVPSVGLMTRPEE